ncbi:arsenical pump-driving ATPase [Undibacterium aquatile]|uniref:Arsenical pump-driving ATPase n=1 Tax=Undibacterium aquatile TaxID=1537398 RepID=A0ABR6XFY7_9BURK|nr:arsenical pump-driving ATPase [Undibacterium aquatile]MBC3811781.1 arsenical pump-driving ATPase [Undibacterium aquatile]
MLFLDNTPKFLFFTGKGGVGKTSVACATAVWLADQGRRVLLVSTDPASNVGQVFGIRIGNSIKAVESVANLFALEIDPQAAAQLYRDRIVTPARGTLPEVVIKAMEEQLSGACTTEIAAFDEFTGLLTNPQMLHDYDHIIFDTAPTGHTIRMLQLPGAWSGFLEEGKGDASCLGPLAGLGKQREKYHEAVQTLADPARTRMVLVARAQHSSLKEAARTHDELAAIGFHQQYLIINGVLPEAETLHDALARAVWKREQAALAAMPEVLRGLPTDHIPLRAFNLVGLDSLRHLLTASTAVNVADSSAAQALPALTDAPSLATLVDGLAGSGHGLIMTMGKGGVGKTTVAAAIAIALAQRGFPVHLTTSDPAAHLLETLEGNLLNLSVSRIDPVAETLRYRQEVMASKGKHLDAQGKALLEEDLRSPCTEEIAVFQAFSRVIREAGKKFVVMDTAPTGHTLLLLDTTGAYHREIERQMAHTGVHYTTPMMQLQDPQQTKIVIVTLAETTPVLEAAGLQNDLRRAGIEPWAWVINNSLAMAQPQSRLLQQRAKNELQQIRLVADQHSQRWAIIPLQAEEPVGIDKLTKLLNAK